MKLMVKTLNILSVFRLFGSMSFISGFIMALFGLGAGNAQIQGLLQGIPIIGALMGGFFGAVIIGLILGLAGGLFAALGAALFNVFAMIVGGIAIEAEEISG